jgi:hypothetical protein
VPGKSFDPAAETASSHKGLAAVWNAARDGSWLTTDRIRSYAILAVSIYAGVVIYMYYLGIRAPSDDGARVAKDFAQVWAAGKAVLQGHPLAPYDLNAHEANLRAYFGAKAPTYVWVYPPFCLAAAAFLALMPFLVALAVEQVLMLAVYLRSIQAILPQRLALLCALALPAVIINVGYGQIATLTAGLAGAAAASLDRRPALAGVLFACMAYKPQLGVAIPVALIAGRRWTTLAAGAATVALLVISSAATFGWASWLDFAASMHTAGDIVFAKGAVDWFKLQSVFAAARMWGMPRSLAWTAQATISLLALAAVAWAWRRPVDTRLKSALLLVAGLLCTPYCFEYDMVVFGPAIALAVSHGLERGFFPWEKTLLAIFFISPLLAGLAGNHAQIPLGAAAILAFTGMLTNSIRRRDAALTRSRLEGRVTAPGP